MDGYTIFRSFFAAALVLILPGAALLAWLPSGQTRRDLLSALTDAAALSIAIQALLALALFVVGVRLTPPLTASLYGLALLAWLAGLWKNRSRRLGLPRWWAAALALLFVAVLVGWRLYQARELALPAWVDSVHHALVVRKIAEYGGLPPDLSPYLPVTFSYHYAFHLITALLAGWSGLAPDQAMLWFGQGLNALVSLSVYRLAFAYSAAGTEVGPSPGWAFPPVVKAGLAALLVNFAFQMPAYYLTWGRYTLLTGLVLLGPLLAAVLELYRQPGQREPWVRFGVLMAGLFLVHYFVVVLVVLFLLVIGLLGLIDGLHDRQHWKTVLSLALLSAASLLVVSPWLWRVWEINQRFAGLRVVTPLDPSQEVQSRISSYLVYLRYLTGPRRAHILLGMAGVGLVFAPRKLHLISLAAWTLLLGWLALPWSLRMDPFRPDHFAIVLFFPAAILLADLLVDACSALGWLARPWSGRLALLLVSALIVTWGVRETRSIINPVTEIANQADLAALRWVQQNIPQDARFFNNGVSWQSTTYRGVDGGYWLLPYTGRQSLIPPVIYGWGHPDYIREVNERAARAVALTDCTPDFWALVREARLTHVYLREGQGSLQPAALRECASLRVVYQHGGVFIYEIVQPE